MVCLATLAAACSGSEDDEAIAPAPATNAAGDEIAPAPTTAEQETTQPEDSSVPAIEEVEDAWLTMWRGAAELVASPETAETAIRSVATADVYERLDATFNPDLAATEEGITNSARSFVNNPVLTELEDGSVRVDDCIFVSPLVTAPSVWYSGIARIDDGAWEIDDLTPEFLLGCTPAAMQEAVFAGYEAYWDARLEFWDPPDPDNPLVDATTTGSFNEFLVGLLADDLAKGQALRGRSMNFPEIIEVNSEFQVVIFDCQLQDPERGLFDIETGERLAGIAPIVEGQTDVKRVTMRLVDGVWKVEDVQGQENRACEHAPTTQALPSI